MKKKIINIIAIIMLLVGTTTICLTTTTNAMEHYQTVDFTTGLITASVLNVRQGPGTNFKVVTKVYKNQYIRVFAQIGDWYVVQTENNIIGAVSSKYVKAVYPNSSNNSNNSNEDTTLLTTDEQEVFDLINQQREQNGLNKLQINDELQNVARAKAKDMVDNNYFSHTSPTYGSPFDMIKKYGITYKTAGENIAGHSSNIGAVTAWMGSAGHRENILNNAYNYTGIAVVNSTKYGKIYVQMFIGK